MKETIEIESFNPYENIFPNRKVVTKQTLDLIKDLRTQGYNVIVKPADARPVEYIFQKGSSGILSDPLFQILINIPISIITGLITNTIQKHYDKKKNNVIVIDKHRNVFENSYGDNIPINELNDLRKKKDILVRSISKCLTTKSPYRDRPFPILLEHKPRIVGWCDLKSTDVGLEIENGILTDKNVYRKIKYGKYQGASITGIAKKSTCSICNSNYVECNHISGNKYDGKECVHYIIESDFIEASIVKEPINKATIVRLAR